MYEWQQECANCHTHGIEVGISCVLIVQLSNEVIRQQTNQQCLSNLQYYL